MQVFVNKKKYMCFKEHYIFKKGSLTVILDLTYILKLRKTML